MTTRFERCTVPKAERLLALLRTGTGSSLEDMTKATGWQAHTVRAAMTGLRKRGYVITRYVVREVMESAVKMARLALEELEVNEEQINRAEAMYRARDKERMRKQIETSDMRAGRERFLTKPRQSSSSPAPTE